MKNAIVVLTRGYKNISEYTRLILRNKCIEKYLKDYPVIIFHEGNIPPEHQSFIQSQCDLPLTFISVEDTWQGGYESMCRFNAFDIWNYCKEYDYIMRIDEDCHLTKCERDPFTMIGDNVYLRSLYWDECHAPTNETLPGAIELLTGVPKEEFYNHKFPYTNVSLSSVQFWLQPEINDLLKQISTSEQQRANRWGDLPVIGSLLNIFAKGKVGVMEGVTYAHLSHDNIIECK